MDSLTQIVLGAAVGEAVLGQKIGNKAILYGAIAGTIPDLDVLAAFFTDTVTALEIHRGFTHSIFFSLLFAPIFAFIVTCYESHKILKDWTLFFFLTLVTHPILDGFTTWGTQLFWPLKLRIDFKNIFVVDPLYTIPFLIFTILVLFQKKDSKKRRLYNFIGLSISSTYIVLSLILKGFAYHEFKNQLKEQNIVYTDFNTKPAPLNTILWTANIDAKTHYLIGYYSFFDTKPIQFKKFPKNHHLLGDLASNKKVKRMIAVSKGWYSINKVNNTLYFNDLRFGTLSLNSKNDDFVFKYKIEENDLGEITFTETEKNTKDAKKLLPSLWKLIKGN